jgi:spore germination protein GerM
LRRTPILLIIVVVAACAVWLVLRQRQGPAPTEEAGQVEKVRDITLYFASADGSSLVPEYRQIASSPGTVENLRRVIEAVISGPEDGGMPTVPSSVRVRAVYIHDKTAYLDFSSEIVDDFSGGTTAEYLLISSIVQTACANFPEVEAVRILVEGEERDTLGGHLRVSKVLRPEQWR